MEVSGRRRSQGVESLFLVESISTIRIFGPSEDFGERRSWSVSKLGVCDG